MPQPFNPQAFNRYSYVFNNPLNNTDPTGNSPTKDTLTLNQIVGQNNFAPPPGLIAPCCDFPGPSFSSPIARFAHGLALSLALDPFIQFQNLPNPHGVENFYNLDVPPIIQDVARRLVENPQIESDGLIGLGYFEDLGGLKALKGLGALGSAGIVGKKGIDDLFVNLTGHRSTHILNRHRAGSGISGKTEFPGTWNDRQILHHVSDIATDPNAIRGIGKYGAPYAIGTRGGISIRVTFTRSTTLNILGKYQQLIP